MFSKIDANNDYVLLKAHLWFYYFRDYGKALELYEKVSAKEWVEKAKTKIKNSTHDFHSSRGLVFCTQCGGTRTDVVDKDCCKENNHQFQAMKEGDDWKPICKKCGITERHNYKKCSF